MNDDIKLDPTLEKLVDEADKLIKKKKGIKFKALIDLVSDLEKNNTSYVITYDSSNATRPVDPVSPRETVQEAIRRRAAELSNVRCVIVPEINNLETINVDIGSITYMPTQIAQVEMTEEEYRTEQRLGDQITEWSYHQNIAFPFQDRTTKRLGALLRRQHGVWDFSPIFYFPGTPVADQNVKLWIKQVTGESFCYKVPSSLFINLLQKVELDFNAVLDVSWEAFSIFVVR